MTATIQTECTRCSELLLEYISASNDLIDTKEQLNGSEPSADELATALLTQALEQRSVLRKRLYLHQELHRIPAAGQRV
ncbi:MAG TPA: hypothetical protein VLY24_21805 [Bryobacteraceae bacterium]|nr:hypothetical protein [Bryobacteraceae bacterium]